jgi:hypothetical protein
MNRKLLFVPLLTSLLTLVAGCNSGNVVADHDPSETPQGAWGFQSGAPLFGSLGPASHPSTVEYLTLYAGGYAGIVTSDEVGVRGCPDATFTEGPGTLTLDAPRLGAPKTYTWSLVPDPLMVVLDDLVLDDGAGNISTFMPVDGLPEGEGCSPYESLAEGQIDHVEGDGALIVDGSGLLYAIEDAGARRLGEVNLVSMTPSGTVRPSVADVTYTGLGDGTLVGSCGGSLCDIAANGTVTSTYSMSDLGMDGTLDGASFTGASGVVSTRLPDGTNIFNFEGPDNESFIAFNEPIRSMTFDGLHVWALADGFDGPVAIAYDLGSSRIVHTIELPKPASGDYGALAYLDSRLYLIQRPAVSTTASLIQIAAP